jgi:hypothetical protein
MTSFWINRGGVPAERHAALPAFTVGSLTEVAAILNGPVLGSIAGKRTGAQRGKANVKRAPRRARPAAGSSRRRA